MTTVINTKKYIIGGIRIKVNFLCPLFDFDKNCGSSLFEENTFHKHDWLINFRLVEEINTDNCETVFTGAEEFADEMPVKWSVIKKENSVGYLFEFENHPSFSSGIAFINEQDKSIDVSLSMHTKQKTAFDPFIHPFGILTLQYLAHLNKGFIIHASAVNNHGKGYVFSAVSGTGKSTMAGLWQKEGHTIINDDRLMIMPQGNYFIVYNTPMPYYQDINKEVKLDKVFLIKQSTHNYIKPLPLLKGTIGMLGNCIQHQYDEKQISQRLASLQTIGEKCGIYECGFKPDTDIVELIKEQFG